MEQTLEPGFTDTPANTIPANTIPANTVEESEHASPTVEHLLYLGALLVAIGLRFINLGETPLLPLEAAQAWPAWLAATGAQAPNVPLPTSALLYGLQSWLFFIAGASDVLARLLPALVGAALVLLPWWWRGWLSRPAALIVAWLLAIDPWLVALSRTSDGAILSIGLGLLALTAVWQWLTSRRAAWERTLAVSLGLLLVSGPLAWSWLPVLALFGWFGAGGIDSIDGAGAVGSIGGTDDVNGNAARPQPGGARIRQSTWLWFGAALLLGASGLLAWVAATGAVGSSLSAWLYQWSGADDGAWGIGWPLLRLAVDQPLLLVFGALGLIILATGRAAPQPRRLGLFLGLWVAWGLLLLVLPGRSPFALPLLGLPLAIATGVLIAYLIAMPLEGVGGLELVVLLVVAAILLVAGSIWLALAVESGTYDTRLAITAAALAVLTLAIWLIFGFWGGWRAAAKVAGLFFAAILLLSTIRSGWMLTQISGRMAPDGLFAVTTLPEARLLASDVQRISSIRFGDPHEAPVQVVTAGQVPNALLGWLLRDMANLSWVMAPDPTVGPPAADGSARMPLILAPASMEQDRGLGGMIGTDYPLTMRWEPSMLPVLPPMEGSNDGGGLPPEELARLRSEQAWSQATRPQLEWLLYRTITNEPPVDSVTLWATPSE